VNPQNTWVKSLTVADLKKMWEPSAQGRVKTWNQIRSEWPNQPLMLFGPGADSGTFDYFTEAVNGKAKASRGDYTASEDDNVLVQGVENNKNALGYFGFAYYVGHKDKMRAVPIINPKGTGVGPSIEAVNDGSYNPLSRPLFIYVRDTAAQGKPFLGICVGLQWLYEGSTEAPEIDGLCHFDAQCERFPATYNGAELKSPHVGWNSLEQIRPDSRLLRGIPEGAFVYFTHSWRAPVSAETAAVTNYGGPFTAAVELGNVMGVQFHPEKSADVGLQVLRNFLEL